MPTDAEPSSYKQEIAGIFSRAANTYGQIGPPFFDYFAERLVDFVGIPTGAKVLDVATGTGAALRAAAQATGASGGVVGVDISYEMTLRAKEKAGQDGISNVHLCVMDAERIGFTGKTFEVVLCAMGVMFFPNLHSVLSQITNVLSKPGRLGISTFGGQDEVSRRVVELAREYGVSKHLVWAPLRTEAEHKELLEKFGFVEVCTASEEADFVYSDLNDWWDMNWSAGLRGILEDIAENQQEQFKIDAYRALGDYAQEDGIHHPRNVLYTKASWPGT